MSTTTHAPDDVAAQAVDVARTAAEEEAAGLVGDHLGVEADEERVVTHFFATLVVGIAGSASHR